MVIDLCMFPDTGHTNEYPVVNVTGSVISEFTRKSEPVVYPSDPHAMIKPFGNL